MWNNLKKPTLMGVVNVTPDSFSDGGRYYSADDAIAHGLELIAQGADILDIGGESTRPGAQSVNVDEEIKRVIPVIKGLKGKGAQLSIDTRHAKTMRAAIEAGADIVNDVMALCGDGGLEVVAKANVPVCLMHMQGNPETMQNKPDYGDVVGDVYAFLQNRVAACVAAGVDINNIIVDPGIGFGKSLSHNLTLLKNINKFNDITGKTLVGTSRKSFIAKVDIGASEDQRIGGSIASVLHAYANGVDIFRVHDVGQTRQALIVWDSLSNNG